MTTTFITRLFFSFLAERALEKKVKFKIYVNVKIISFFNFVTIRKSNFKANSKSKKIKKAKFKSM